MSTVHRIQVPIPFPLRWVNCYYIHDSVPTLVDTGVNTEDAFQAVQAALAARGGSIEGIRRIILTHCHLDHIGLAGRISRVSGAEVYVHRWDQNKIIRGVEQEFQERSKVYREFFVEAGMPSRQVQLVIDGFLHKLGELFTPLSGEKPLEGGEVFSFDDFRLGVIHTPGHSPGSICLYNREDEVLFTGDTLLGEISSNPVVELKAPEEKKDYSSLVEYELTLERLRGLSVITVLPGHGSPFAQHWQRIQELRNHHQARCNEVLDILQSHCRASENRGGMTELEVSKALFPTLEGVEIFLGLSEARAHLELLNHQGLVSVQKRSGQRRYQPSQEPETSYPPRGH